MTVVRREMMLGREGGEDGIRKMGLQVAAWG